MEKVTRGQRNIRITVENHKRLMQASKITNIPAARILDTILTEGLPEFEKGLRKKVK